MKILQLYYKLPFPMNDGGAYAIYHSSLAMLSQNADLRILAMDLLKSQEATRGAPASFIKRTRFESVGVDNRINPWKAFTNLFGTESYFVERFYSEAYSEKLKDILSSSTFDVIQLEHLYLGMYLDVIRRYSKAKVVLRAQNVESLLWKNYLEKIRNPFSKRFISIATQRLETFEKRILASVDGIMALSGEDARCFKAYGTAAPTVAIPVGMALERFSEIDPEKQYRDFPVLFHLGSMDWKPNMLGVKWFITQVWPLLKKQHPEIRMVIAGKNMPAWFFKQADKNLIVQEKVEDALLFQEDKAILIVPMLVGSGIRIKILEGMALGKTIISTRVGAKGIACEDGRNILLADSPQQFVEQIGRCMHSQAFCRQIGKNAQQLISEKYELEKTGAGMMEFYQSLLQPEATASLSQ
jgi:glycosyltransferase involved in cell wall biosynthesis